MKRYSVNHCQPLKDGKPVRVSQLVDDLNKQDITISKLLAELEALKEKLAEKG